MHAMRALVALFLVALSAPLPAQERDGGAGSERPEWVESAPQKQDERLENEPLPEWVPTEPDEPERSVPERAELHFLVRAATTESQGDRVDAVHRIERLVRNGRFSPTDPALIELLSRVALAPVLIERRGSPETGYPIARLAAVEALAFMEGAEVRETLLRVLRHEREAAVLAAAMRSLAALQPFPDDELSSTIVAMMQRLPWSTLDGHLGMSILDAVEVLDQVGAGIQSQELYRQLIQLALHSQSSAVRKRTYTVLNELRERGLE